MHSEVPRFRAVDVRPDDRVLPQMSWPAPADTALAGARVRLRPYSPADADELFRAVDDDRVWAHVAGRPESRAELTEQMAGAASGRLTWVVRLRTDVEQLAAETVVGSSDDLDVSIADVRRELT